MGTRLPRVRFVSLAAAAFLLPLVGLAQPVQAQQDSLAVEATEIRPDQIERFVRAHLAISEVRDQLQQEIARWHEDNRRQEVRQEADEQIEAILEEHGVTSEEFEEYTRFVSMDQEWRDAFEEALERVQSSGGA